MSRSNWQRVAAVTVLLLLIGSTYGVYHVLEQRHKPRKSIWHDREKVAKLVALSRSRESTAPDELGKFLGGEYRDLAIWALGRQGPRAISLAPQLQRLRDEAVRENAKKKYWRTDSRRVLPSVALERIAGCPSDQSSIAEMRFRDYYTHQQLKIPGIQGEDSLISQPSARIVLSPEEWDALWLEHGGNISCRPKVDFSREMVVGVFLGDTTWTEFATLYSIEETKRGTLIRYHDTYSDAISAVPVAPYIFVRIPKKTMPVTVVRTRSWAMSMKKPEDTVMLVRR